MFYKRTKPPDFKPSAARKSSRRPLSSSLSLCAAAFPIDTARWRAHGRHPPRQRSAFENRQNGANARKQAARMNIAADLPSTVR